MSEHKEIKKHVCVRVHTSRTLIYICGQALWRRSCLLHTPLCCAMVLLWFVLWRPAAHHHYLPKLRSGAVRSTRRNVHSQHAKTTGTIRHRHRHSERPPWKRTRVKLRLRRQLNGLGRAGQKDYGLKMYPCERSMHIYTRYATYTRGDKGHLPCWLKNKLLDSWRKWI